MAYFGMAHSLMVPSSDPDASHSARWCHTTHRTQSAWLRNDMRSVHRCGSWGLRWAPRRPAALPNPPRRAPTPEPAPVRRLSRARPPGRPRPTTRPAAPSPAPALTSASAAASSPALRAPEPPIVCRPDAAPAKDGRDADPRAEGDTGGVGGDGTPVGEAPDAPAPAPAPATPGTCDRDAAAAAAVANDAGRTELGALGDIPNRLASLSESLRPPAAAAAALPLANDATVLLGPGRGRPRDARGPAPRAPVFAARFAAASDGTPSNSAAVPGDPNMRKSTSSTSTSRVRLLAASGGPPPPAMLSLLNRARRLSTGGDRSIPGVAGDREDAGDAGDAPDRGTTPYVTPARNGDRGPAEDASGNAASISAGLYPSWDK